MKWLALLLLAASIAACGHQRPEFLPSPRSMPATVPGSGFLAGFGRADITPPPGVGLDGNGFEGRQADGWHHRLYARAMVLQGTNGERIAYLVADLSHLSAVIQRLTAARIVEETGIGADRLIVSATHGHSAPGNFYGESAYNLESGALPGFDRYMVEFMVAGFSRAIMQAFRDLKPARAGWVSAEIDGLTWNRSFGAFSLNTTNHFGLPPGTKNDSTARQHSINRTWTMLRIEQCTPACRPVGALSVFPMHGTGIPPASRLFDGDLHALVERGLELHIEDSNATLSSSLPASCPNVTASGIPVHAGPRRCTFAPEAVHLFANGTEGDVAPMHLPGTRCGEEVEPPHFGGNKLQLRRALEPEGPRLVRGSEVWLRPPGKSEEDCLSLARRSVNLHADSLVALGIKLFDDAAHAMSSDIVIHRAFTTVDMRDLVSASNLCEPRSGTANFAGADDIRSRLNHWKFLWFLPSGIEEGRAAIRRDYAGCSGAKMIGLGPFQSLMVRDYGLPRYAQFSVVQIGDAIIAATPWEITSEAGARMLEAIERSAPTHGVRPVLIGLANGYFQYVTTPEEYEAQEYEGGSNLYGPQTAAAIQGILSDLASRLTAEVPADSVAPIRYRPGRERSFFPRPTNGPPASAIARVVVSTTCGPVTLPTTPGAPKRTDVAKAESSQPRLFTGRWIDAYPGRLVPADGQVVEVQRRLADGTYQPVAWDDGDNTGGIDRRVEVRAIRPRGTTGYEWEVRWVTTALRNGDRLRLVPASRGPSGGDASVAEIPGTDRRPPRERDEVTCR